MKNNDNEKGPSAPFLLRDMTDRQTWTGPYGILCSC
jgi:hypothetical protein